MSQHDMNQLTLEIEANPDDASAYHQRGMLYYQLGLYPQALNDFNRVIALSPEEPDGYQQRGCTYEQLGMTDQAETDFKRALALSLTDLSNHSLGIAYTYKHILKDTRGVIYNKAEDYHQNAELGCT